MITTSRSMVQTGKVVGKKALKTIPKFNQTLTLRWSDDDIIQGSAQ